MAVELASLKDHDLPKRSLSLVVVEIICAAFVIILGFQTILTVAAQQVGISFQTYLFITPLLMIACLIIVIWSQWSVLKQVEVTDKRILAGLFLIGTLLAIIPIITNHPTSDDYYYTPNVVYFIEHPTKPMDFEIHFLFGAIDKQIISQELATSLAYDYFRGVVAYYLKIDFLTIYFRSGTLTLFLLPLVYFLLISRFVEDTRRAFDGTLLAISVLLLSMEGPRTFGIITFWDAHMGKLVLFSIGFQLFTAYSISFLKRPSVREWILLFACATTLIGMTSSAVALIPILAVILLGAFIVTFRLSKGDSLSWKALLLRATLYIASLGYVLGYTLFLYTQLKQGATTGNPFDLVGPDGFLGNLFYFSSPRVPFTLTLIVLSIIAVFIFVRGWQRIFLLAWMAVLFTTFLNPIATPLLTTTIMPPSIYWRMFYLMPFPLMASIAAISTPIDKITQKIQFVILPIAFAVFLLTTYQKGFLSFSFDQLPVRNLNVAREISRVAPAGLMLAPTVISGPVTMLSAKHVQLVTLPVALTYWLNPLGQEDDAITREIVDRFLTNTVHDPKEMIKLLNAYPQIKSIVLSKDTAQSTALLKRLKNRGFTKSAIFGEYLLLWK